MVGGEEEEEERCGVGGGLMGTKSNGAFWVFGKNTSATYAAPLRKMAGTNGCPMDDIVKDYQSNLFLLETKLSDSEIVRNLVGGLF